MQNIENTEKSGESLMEHVILFCFAFAGGTASYYYKWEKLLCNRIGLEPIEIDGRGKKYGLSLKTDIKDIVESIYSEICLKIDNNPFIFFGHSMGGLIAYEMYYKLLENKVKLPDYIIFSSCMVPQSMESRIPRYCKNDEEFLEIIKANGGTPREFFEHPELISVFLPILRADYQVVDTYHFMQGREKLTSNVCVLNGRDDFEIMQGSGGWQELCQGECKEIMFEGGHFFINDHMGEVVSIVNNIVLKMLDG